MNVNFLEQACQEVTIETVFGICDDPPPSTVPAYLDFTNIDKWIAMVENPNSKEITFTAIDRCIVILRPNGEEESRCEGMLTCENQLIFLELKSRGAGRWLGKARDQLTITINLYFLNHGIAGYTTKKAYVANLLRPHFHYAYARVMDDFLDDTGFILIVDNTISI